MSDFRFRRNWRGKMILQIKEIFHHVRDLNGSGHFDEWDTTRWRDARWDELPPPPAALSSTNKVIEGEQGK